MILISKTAGGTTGEWFLRLTSATQLQFSIVNSSLSRIDLSATTYAINDGKWHYLVGTYNGSKALQSIYLDGKLVATSSVNSGSILTTTQPVIVGGFYGASMLYQGYLDEIKVWNRDLAIHEILSNWNNLPNTFAPYVDTNGNVTISGSLLGLSGFTGSLNGTSSWASNNISSSYAKSASYAPVQISSSYSLTASYALNGGGSSLVSGSSYNITSSWANNSITSSYSLTSSFAKNAASSSVATTLVNPSGVINSQLGEFAIETTGNSPFSFISSIGTGFLIDASGSFAFNSVNYNDGIFQFNDASRILTLGDVNDDFQGTLLSIDDNNQYIIAQPKFGVNVAPAHALDVSGDINFTTNLLKNGLPYTASLSNKAISSSYAGTASVLLGSITSASYALTSSYALNGGGTSTISYNTLTSDNNGYFTASFNNPKSLITISTGSAYNFTCSNVPSGTTYLNTSVFIQNTSLISSSLNFPSNWTFIGLLPLTLPPTQSAYLNLESFGSTIVAGWGQQYK